MNTSTTQNFIDRFGGRLWYAMPDGRAVYSHRGRDHQLEGDFEAVMKAGMEQGKNLLISTFPAVDLYPDPACDY